VHRDQDEARRDGGATQQWADGVWRDKETGEPVQPPEYGKTYDVDLNTADGGSFLIAYPSQTDA